MVAYFTNCFTSCFLFVLKYIDKCFIVLMWIYLGYLLSFAFTHTDTHKAPIMALHVGVVLHIVQMCTCRCGFVQSQKCNFFFKSFLCLYAFFSLLCFAFAFAKLPSIEVERFSFFTLSSMQCIITFQIFVNHTHENKNLQMILIYISQIMSETDHLLFI